MRQYECGKDLSLKTLMMVLPSLSLPACPVMPSPQFFDGQALVSWSETDVTVAVPWYMGLMFRTRQPAGTLMQANAGAHSTINLMVRYKTHAPTSTNHTLRKIHAERHLTSLTSFLCGQEPRTLSMEMKITAPPLFLCPPLPSFR